MKKILMSVFLLFVLVLSPLGSLASHADELDNVVLSNLNPADRTIVQGENIILSFDITNNEDVAVDFELDISNPDDGNDNTLEIEVSEDTILVEAGATETIEFEVETSVSSVAGTYSGEIYVEGDVPEGELDVTITDTLDYDVIVEAQNPSLVVESLDDDGDLVISGEEDTSQDNEFTIRNDGNMDLEDLMLSLTGNFNDDDVEIEIYVGDENGDRLYDDGSNEVSLGDFATGDSQTITITAVIPDGINEDIYFGELTVYATNYETETTTTFDLLVKVEPEVCEDGRVADGEPVDGPNTGNGLRIANNDIDNPDEGDSFEIGEEFDVEVTVKNEASEDLDVVVEVMLYNLDESDEIETWESESIEINEDDSEDFALTIAFPNDKDLDEDDTYILYIKAYEDGNEDDYCNYNSVEIELERNKHDVVVDEFTLIPSVVKQGQTVQFSVDVENIGTEKEDDVYIQVINTELGLNLESNKFDLKQYDKSGNDAVKTFNFEIPEDAVAQDYYIEARVYFDDADETSSLFQTLTVLESEDSSDNGTGDEDTGDDGSSGDDGTTTTGTTTYTPTGNVIGSLSGSNVFWIIGDIVLAILVIVLLVLIFRRK